MEDFIPPSILNDNFAILRLKLLSLSTQNILLYAFLVFKVNVEKSAVILID
jgi:hypothetical protein